MNREHAVVNNIFCCILSKIRIGSFLFTALIIGFMPALTYAAQGDRIAVSVTIVARPCIINNGQSIPVDFGSEIMTNHVDESSSVATYSIIPIPYTLSGCKGSSNLKITITGDSAVFDGKVLRTDVDDLAIKIIKENGKVFPINTPMNFTYPNTPKLFAAPAKRKGSTLIGKKFSASATLKVEYQ